MAQPENLSPPWLRAACLKKEEWHSEVSGWWRDIQGQRNHEIPETGKVVECLYLYAVKESGCIFEPDYLRMRDDMTSEECSTAQLKNKAEPEEKAA
jgi:hypothetical protein